MTDADAPSQKLPFPIRPITPSNQESKPASSAPSVPAIPLPPALVIPSSVSKRVVSPEVIPTGEMPPPISARQTASNNVSSEPIAPANPVIPEVPLIQEKEAHSIPEFENLPFGHSLKTKTNKNNGNFYTTPSLFKKAVVNAKESTPELIEHQEELINTHRKWKLPTIIMGVLMIIALIVIIILYSGQMGVAGTLIGAGAALVPFALIFATIWWIGRFNPLPWALRIGAFFWGIGLSILTTLGLSFLGEQIFGPVNSLLELVAVQAPITEEFSKGLGLIIIALLFKRYITGPIDGLVIMSLSALGFAFTENIQYLSGAYAETGGGVQGMISLGFTWYARAILSPFAHIMFSAIMGLIVGYAIMRGFNKWIMVLLTIAVYPVAVALHALWNGSSVLGGEDWALFYVLIEVPLFIAIVWYVIWLRQSNITTTYRRVHAFAVDGWFEEYEVDALTTMEGRQRLKRWARTQSDTVAVTARTLMQQVIELNNISNLISLTKKEDKRDKLIVDEKKLLYRIGKNKKMLIDV